MRVARVAVDGYSSVRSLKRRREEEEKRAF
jgi:hypothetical protein